MARSRLLITVELSEEESQTLFVLLGTISDRQYRSLNIDKEDQKHLENIFDVLPNLDKATYVDAT